MKLLNNIEIKNKKIVLRADLNVPVMDGKISDYSRINSVLPTINLLCNNKNKIFIIAHYEDLKVKLIKIFFRILV